MRLHWSRTRSSVSRVRFTIPGESSLLFTTFLQIKSHHSGNRTQGPTPIVFEANHQTTGAVGDTLKIENRPDPRAHKEGYAAHLPPPTPLQGPQKHFFQDFVFIYCVCLLGGSFVVCAPVDGSLLFLALTNGLGKHGNIARASDVKLYFRLFRYVNPCVKSR